MDNILIYLRNEEEHEVLVKKVLQILMDNDLASNINKCHFHTKELNFLGYIISPEGVKIANDCVKTILDWEPPTSIKEVQMFMGFANFYRRFIPNFSGIYKPITDLLKGGEQPKRRFYWTAHAQAAFEELKKRFTEAPILRHFDPNKPSYVEADASDFALGAALSQIHEGRLHPIAFYSRKMIPAELNYEVYDKEMLAIVTALTHWRHYLENPEHQITIYSDHQNLEYFQHTTVLNRR